MAGIGLDQLKKVDVQDRKMLADIEVMLGPEPTEMGFVKNLFWGRFRKDLVLPYPRESKEERKACDDLLVRLEAYLKNEHPAILIDQEQYIPQGCFDRLFELGVMGLTVPKEYGGLGLGVTSYNRVLELIGRYCASTAVIVSAHQSIGCKAIVLFGTDEQKQRFLPGVARRYLSAFCLSEPNVGSDAAGQETHCELSADGSHYVLNGEKKWSTSGALSGVFTVMAKQQVTDPVTGKTTEGVTALICTPDMPGIDIFQKNRSKTGIRGTWQARIRFTDVRVPRENLLHKEGKGLYVALTCLNYGRCTLSAGVSGAAKYARDQAVKWVQTRYQFGRPLASFELMQQKIAYMSAYTYAIDALLYMVTGMLDRKDRDIMVETAVAKLFSSHYGWNVIDEAMQMMGGEGYVTENEFERVWRDNRIHRIVEGSNEVMYSFVFGYGGKQLAEQMIAIRDAFGWDEEEGSGSNLRRIKDNVLHGALFKRALSLGAELYGGKKPERPVIEGVHPSLQRYARRLARQIQVFSRKFKMASKQFREEIIKRQAVQARLADSAAHLFVMTCALAKMDMQIRSGARGPAFERDRAAFIHFFDLAEIKIRSNHRELWLNADRSLHRAAEAAMKYTETLPDSDFYIHEASPVATGKPIPGAPIPQFPGSGPAGVAGDGADVRPEVQKEG